MTDYDPKSVEGIPESGVQRLEQNRQGLYTSDLSVNEFLLITEAGFDPVGLVVGSSIFHIGIQVQSEAQELAAEGIVGVSLSERSHGWGSHVIGFFALGTAIVSTGEGTKIEPPVTVLDLNDPRSSG
jgi:hypothetical protein